MPCSMLDNRSYNIDYCDDTGLWDYSSWFTKHGYGTIIIVSCWRWSLSYWFKPLDVQAFTFHFWTFLAPTLKFMLCSKTGVFGNQPYGCELKYHIYLL